MVLYLLAAGHRIDDTLATGQQKNEVLLVRKSCTGLAVLVVDHRRPSAPGTNPLHRNLLLLM